MKFIKLFDKYFLILMLFQAIVYTVVDYRHFYDVGMIKIAKKTRAIGIIIGIISISLYLVKVFWV